MQRVILVLGDSRRGSSGWRWTYRLMDERRNHLAATAEISRGGAVIIVQHATQTLTAPDRSTIPSMGFVRDDQPVVETLVVSLAMIMHHEFVNSFAQRSLTEQDDALQTGFLDAADESFGVGIQVR
jgi:hypothetical protein